jgi:hypothetical protein
MRPEVAPLVPSCNYKEGRYDHDIWKVSKTSQESKSLDICYRGQGRAA